MIGFHIPRLDLGVVYSVDEKESGDLRISGDGLDSFVSQVTVGEGPV